MRILYYTWHEISEDDMTDTLIDMGHEVVKFCMPFSDYEDDKIFSENLEKEFLEKKCDIFFSFDFFPLIAKMAERQKKTYISWVYDCPHNSLYSPSVKSEFVSLFVFDKVQYYHMQKLKGEKVYHMPLAVNTRRLNEILDTGKQQRDYLYDVSFVGSLYEKNLYQKIKYLPEFLKGYIQGIISAQLKIYGYNFVRDAIDDAIQLELCKYVKMNLDASYLFDEQQLYADMINAEVTHQERIGLLKAISDCFNVTVFTASQSDELPKNIFSRAVTYDMGMPQVFRNSKINLNITLRSITSGIPLRALDIMGAGGFLLTNYQPEIAERFVDGREVVMYESKEDMIKKIAYYLENEEEREKIAYNGWKKVNKEFSYEYQINKIFSLI